MLFTLSTAAATAAVQRQQQQSVPSSRRTEEEDEKDEKGRRCWGVGRSVASVISRRPLARSARTATARTRRSQTRPSSLSMHWQQRYCNSHKSTPLFQITTRQRSTTWWSDRLFRLFLRFTNILFVPTTFSRRSSLYITDGQQIVSTNHVIAPLYFSSSSSSSFLIDVIPPPSFSYSFGFSCCY